MPLIVTPRQLSDRAAFYHQLAALISAGVGVIQALDMIRSQRAIRSFGPPLAETIRLLESGWTLSEAWRSIRNWLPAFDIALVEAGEKSGRLDSCFRLLE